MPRTNDHFALSLAIALTQPIQRKYTLYPNARAVQTAIAATVAANYSMSADETERQLILNILTILNNSYLTHITDAENLKREISQLLPEDGDVHPTILQTVYNYYASTLAHLNTVSIDAAQNTAAIQAAITAAQDTIAADLTSQALPETEAKQRMFIQVLAILHKSYLTHAIPEVLEQEIRQLLHSYRSVHFSDSSPNLLHTAIHAINHYKTSMRVISAAADAATIAIRTVIPAELLAHPSAGSITAFGLPRITQEAAASVFRAYSPKSTHGVKTLPASSLFSQNPALTLNEMFSRNEAITQLTSNGNFFNTATIEQVQALITGLEAEDVRVRFEALHPNNQKRLLGIILQSIDDPSWQTLEPSKPDGLLAQIRELRSRALTLRNEDQNIAAFLTAINDLQQYGEVGNFRQAIRDQVANMLLHPTNNLQIESEWQQNQQLKWREAQQTALGKILDAAYEDKTIAKHDSPVKMIIAKIRDLCERIFTMNRKPSHHRNQHTYGPGFFGRMMPTQAQKQIDQIAQQALDIPYPPRPNATAPSA